MIKSPSRSLGGTGLHLTEQIYTGEQSEMYRLLRATGDQGIGRAGQSAKLGEVEAAALACRADPAEDAAGDPCTGMRKKFGPGMFRLYVPSFDGGEVIREGTVPPTLE